MNPSPRAGRALYRLLFAVLCLAVAGPVMAAANEIRRLPDIAYLGAGRTEQLDLYLPPETRADELHPALVWIHGNEGDKEEIRGKGICELLAAHGYVCVSVNYGKGKPGKAGGPSPITDCKNAVRFLRVRAAEYHIDPARIAVGGGSSGASFALLVAFSSGHKELEPESPYPGVSNQVGAVLDFYGHMGSPKRRGFYIPDYVSADSPPVLIVQGEKDTTVTPDNSVTLAKTLQAHAVPHEMLLLPEGEHSFRLNTTWDDKPLGTDLGPVVLNFLNQYLRPAPAAAH